MTAWLRLTGKDGDVAAALLIPISRITTVWEDKDGGSVVEIQDGTSHVVTQGVNTIEKLIKGE